jgi:hypothetical protein
VVPLRVVGQPQAWGEEQEQGQPRNFRKIGHRRDFRGDKRGISPRPLQLKQRASEQGLPLGRQWMLPLAQRMTR